MQEVTAFPYDAEHGDCVLRTDFQPPVMFIWNDEMCRWEHDGRIIWNLMGVNIGFASGWDLQDTFSIIIYDLELNETGRRFVPEFQGGDLGIDWEAGTAAVYDRKGNETFLTTDWSIFNKTGGPGWQEAEVAPGEGRGG